MGNAQSFDGVSILCHVATGKSPKSDQNKTRDVRGRGCPESFVKRNTKIALWLVVVSCAFWAGLLVLPFLGVEGATRAWIAGALIVAGEATFWIGVLIVGREAMLRHRHKLWPGNWFSRRPPS